MTKKHVCEYCHGVLTGSRRVPLERCVIIHLESCPAAPPRVKRPQPVPATPRKRVIPRQVLDA